MMGFARLQDLSNTKIGLDMVAGFSIHALSLWYIREIALVKWRQCWRIPPLYLPLTHWRFKTTKRRVFSLYFNSSSSENLLSFFVKRSKNSSRTSPPKCFLNDSSIAALKCSTHSGILIRLFSHAAGSFNSILSMLKNPFLSTISVISSGEAA